MITEPRPYAVAVPRLRRAGCAVHPAREALVTSRMHRAWAIEYTRSPLEECRRGLFGVWGHPCHTLLFKTREKARFWLASHKQAHAWAYRGRWAVDGGTRIYRDARVVSVTITIEVAG